MFFFTPAVKFVNCAGDGTIYCAMQKTLCTYDTEAQAWKQATPQDLQPLPPSLANHFATLLAANTADELNAAFLALGVADPLAENMNLLWRAIGSKVVVLNGPAATAFWRRSRSDDAADVGPASAHGLSMHCSWRRLVQL